MVVVVLVVVVVVVKVLLAAAIIEASPVQPRVPRAGLLVPAAAVPATAAVEALPA